MVLEIEKFTLSPRAPACYTPLEPGACSAYAPAKSVSILMIRFRQWMQVTV